MSRRKTALDLDDLITIVDDETYQEFAELCGQEIVHVIIWEDTVTDALDDRPSSAEDQSFFDIDLYLRDGIYLELFGVLCYKNLESDPLQSMDSVTRYISILQSDKLELLEVAVDEEDNLVLVLGRKQEANLYLAVGATAIAEWTELP